MTNHTLIKNNLFNPFIFYLALILLLCLGSQLVQAQPQTTLHTAAKHLAPSKLPANAQTALEANQPHTTIKAKEPRLVPDIGWRTILHYIFLCIALFGILPVVVFFIEYNLSGLHAFINHFGECKDYCPNVSVIIPAWNEALVLEHTIDILLKMDYPLSALRIYIIDDGSTDETPELLAKKKIEYPENIYHIRKEGGGKGKAHAVNYGLDAALADPWTEAVLLIDADISFKKDALRRMTRHLSDPQVGAVTAYIKVGNRRTNYISRTVGYEYIVSQSIARRAQNVMGVIACLAGGAQLHTRANIEAQGGHIDTTTLAEDTYTTMLTQTMGKTVIYEGNAFVYAEEPTAIVDIWKQRFRWARGNLQITKAFMGEWFRGKNSRLGSYLFGVIWFCVVLTPILMIGSVLGLVGLYFLSSDHSSQVFFYLASISFFVYLYTTMFTLYVDKRTSRLSWFEGIIYPGFISLFILIFSVNPRFFFNAINVIFNVKDTHTADDIILLFMISWSALCMICAWLVFRLEYMGVSTKITNFLLLFVGYGPLLCTINLAAYIAEIKKPNLRWDKTEKIGSKRVIRDYYQPTEPFDFNKALERDEQREYKFFCKEIVSLVVVTILFIFLNYL